MFNQSDDFDAGNREQVTAHGLELHETSFLRTRRSIIRQIARSDNPSPTGMAYSTMSSGVHRVHKSLMRPMMVHYPAKAYTS